MAKRFTLFQLDSERGLRGGERQLLYLAAHLRGRGHENVIVCRAGHALQEEAARQGFPTLTLPFLGEWDPISAWRLRSAARRAAHPPVLHAHTAHTAALASLASRLGAGPWVAHRRVDFHLNGSLSLRLKYGSAHRVVAVSQSIRDVLVEDGMARDRIDVVPDCLPLTDEEARATAMDSGPLRPPGPEERAQARSRLREEFGVPPDAPLIGNLAALVPHKDQATLIRSMPEVLKGLHEARLVILGDGPLRRGLKELSDSLGVASAILMPGRRPDPRPWLHSLDLYVQSSWGEGMGSVLLEAMACGIPIVATTAGGIPEVVRHGRSALLVPPRDPGRLAQALLGALRDRGASARRAEAASQDLAAFGLARAGDRMLEVYRKVSDRGLTRGNAASTRRRGAAG